MLKNILNNFQLIGLTPPGLIDPSIAIAANRAGGIGILDLEFIKNLDTAFGAIQRMVSFSQNPSGIKISCLKEDIAKKLISKLHPDVKVIILTIGQKKNLEELVDVLHKQKKIVFFEVTSVEQAELGVKIKVDGLLVKGNEAAGFVGEKTSFVLLQQIVFRFSLPLWVQGGIGLYTAPACYAAGASGVVLDSQLSLTKESPFSETIKKEISFSKGNIIQDVGEEIGLLFRFVSHFGFSLDKTIRNLESRLTNEIYHSDPYAIFFKWKRALQKFINWDNNPSSLWPMGQDLALASSLAYRFGTVGSIFSAIKDSIAISVNTSKSLKSFSANSPLATSHGTLYPIVQGPMARVSDNAAFADIIADEGGLPFIALSSLKGSEVEDCLKNTAISLGDKPWGVGILGFLKKDLLRKQLKVIYNYSPPFAIIAGGLPSQVIELENNRIRTYVHTPSVHILEMFIEKGIKRFIFEGNECGGHIGPLSGFILWEVMIGRLLEKVKSENNPKEYHILFAGGIHDALSASMVATMAAPLAKLGVKIGVLLGTAYLFTKEIVNTGTIVEDFQKEVIRCSYTRIIKTGPGHIIRCSDTDFVKNFSRKKRRLEKETLHKEKISLILEKLLLGRSSIASKGFSGNPSNGLTPNSEGLYMVGQLAALKGQTLTIKELHEAVGIKSNNILNSLVFEKKNINKKSPIDIAIIGMACYLPKASDIKTYWENILNKINSISEIPSNRWNYKLFFEKDKKAKDKIYSKWGGFLDEITFDPLEFGMPPNSLESIDPSQLLTLKTVKNALIDAGYDKKEFNREKTSVIIGTGGVGDFGQKYIFRSALPLFFENIPDSIMDYLPKWTEDSFSGILANVTAGRVANRFNLGGVNYTVDAACGSSLAALYNSVRELETKRSDIVITGGVDTGQSPFTYLCFSKTHALSPEGRCKAFDKNADGTVVSEGLAFMVLKRLKDAERDGDNIYAVIKSVAGSSDGRDKSLTAPRPEGQIIALRRAYKDAGVSPATVDLLEAHGTGTIVGDKVEAESAAKLMVESGAVKHGCAIGSVKSMIGHTKCAAGFVGLIKATLSLYHKILPPTMGVEKPNPDVDFTNGPLYINTETRPWINSYNHPRRAGISSFGFGGTNFHAVLEEYRGNFLEKNQLAPMRKWSDDLFLFNAESKNELITFIKKVESFLLEGESFSLGDIAFTLNKEFTKKVNLSEKHSTLSLAVVASSLANLREKLSIALNRLVGQENKDIHDPRGIYYTEKPLLKEGKVAFLFPGQGSQYPNMLRELSIIFPEIIETFEDADRVLKGRFSHPLSRYIFPPPSFTTDGNIRQKEELAKTDVAQSALGASSLALFKILLKMNITPDMVGGHSYGEYTALCAAGVFTEDSLYDISETRGRLMIKGANGQDLGTMAAVKAAPTDLKKILKGIDGVVISNYNSPSQTVISGTKEVIKKTIKILKSNSIFTVNIPVLGAFHSPSVEPAKKLISEYLRKVSFSLPKIKVYSNTNGLPYKPDVEGIMSCLCEHIVKPVQFTKQIRTMYDDGAKIFIEVGPGTVLTSLISKILKGKRFLSLPVDGSGEKSHFIILKTVGQMAVNGMKISLDNLYHGRSLKEIDLNNPVNIKKADVSPTTWFINGPTITNVSLNKKDFGKNKFELIKIEKNTDHKPVMSQNNEILGNHMDLMKNFLDTHKKVMMSYFGNTQALDKEDPFFRGKPLNKERSSEMMSNRIENRLELPFPEPSEPLKEVNINKAVLKEKLLIITAERTGYPKDIIGMDANIEADLGIDSIKRIEILNAFSKSLPDFMQQKIQTSMEDISVLKTLKAIIQKVDEILSGGQKEEKNQTDLPRYIRHSKPEPLSCNIKEKLTGFYLIIVDQLSVAEILAHKLNDLGVETALIENHILKNQELLVIKIAELRKIHSAITGIINLSSLSNISIPENLKQWRNINQIQTKGFFRILKLCSEDLQDAARRGNGKVLLCSLMGGNLGRDREFNNNIPVCGGSYGLIKTVKREWAGIDSKIIDFDNNLLPEKLSSKIIDELLYSGESIEIGYPSGQRRVFYTAKVTIDKVTEKPLCPKPDWVILITGGARGITAEVANKLVSLGSSMIIVGRTIEPAEENKETSGVKDVSGLRNIFLKKAKEEGISPLPSQIEKQVKKILQEREIRFNLKRLRGSGCKVEYSSVDVRDEKKFGSLIENIYNRFGRLDAVVHGAGIIEDKLIVDKSYDSFDRVFDTKIDSAFILSKYLHQESLKIMIFFSSVSGCFGNKGQSDYAAANELLNCFALYLNKQWANTRVVSINWGPWDTVGMASMKIKNLFDEEGITPISISSGCGFFMDEFLYGDKSQVEVIAGKGPWEKFGKKPFFLSGLITETESNEFFTLEHTLNLKESPYLNDHLIDGNPVLPAACAIELLAQLTQFLYPDKLVTEIRNLVVYKGVVLNKGKDHTVLFKIYKNNISKSDSVKVSAEIIDPKNRFAYYKADLFLQNQFDNPPDNKLIYLGCDNPLNTETLYNEYLFHGKLFQLLSSIDRHSLKGMDGIVEPSKITKWFNLKNQYLNKTKGFEFNWLFDPGLIDIVPQLALVWSRIYKNKSALPSRFGKIKRFAQPPKGESLKFFFRIKKETNDHTIIYNASLTDGKGKVMLLMEHIESTCSTGLNKKISSAGD